MHIVSLYDASAEMLKPWAAAGFECYAYDIVHEGDTLRDGIRYIHADLYAVDTWPQLIARHREQTYFVAGFPPCTELCVGGACHWRRKAEENPDFQKNAARHAIQCATFATAVACDKWCVENPPGRLPSLWRKYDLLWNPCDYGGHLIEQPHHPLYPQIIPAQDAYRKRSCLWVGPTFVLPTTNPVEPIVFHRTLPCGRRKGCSPLWRSLGGKSARTKAIRSLTPRGFARAVFEANRIG